MAQIVKLRRSSVPGQKPTNSNLQLGELALNTTDGKVYMAVSGSLGPSVEELISTNTVNTGSLQLVGSITASAFSGSAVGLTNVPFRISGSDVEGNQSDKTFTKLHFDSDTGLNVSESAPGTAFISIGSHFKDIFVSGSPILSATGSDAFEIIPTGGVEITTSITDTNGNGYVKELNISTTTLSSSLNNRMDTITGSITTLSGSVNSLNTFTSSVVLTSQTSSMNVLSASYALTAAFALNAGAGGGGSSVTDGAYAVLNQTTPATTWTFKHSLGQRYPIFQVFDSNGSVILPSQITTIDIDNATITFPSNQTGKVIASLGTGPGGLSQYFSSNATWSLAHNLGSDYPIVTIWDTNRSIIFPQKIESIDNNNIKIYFSTPVAGYVNVAKGGHIISGSVGAGSIDFIGSNLVSGSGQILITGTTGYSTFSGSISSSIGSLSSSVATTTLVLSSSILSLSSSVATTTSGLSSSIGSLSSSVATTTNTLSSSVATTTNNLSSSIGSLSSSIATTDSNQNTRLDNIETSTGSLNSFTSSINTTIKSKLDSDGVISGSIQVLLTGTTGYSTFSSSISTSIGLLSSSVATTTSGLTSTITSLSSSLSSSIDSLSSSVATTTNNLSSSISSSIGSLSSSVASINNAQNGRLDSLETASGSIRTNFNTFTSSYTTVSGSIDSRLDVLEAYSGSQLVPSSSMSFRTLQTDVYCKNMSGTQINKGTVVRIVGSVGDNPLIGVASFLTEGQSANTLGIASENIPNDGFGLVITEGVLTGVNTDGMTAGQLLFLGANGTFTTSYPVPPNHGVRLGEVLRVQQNQGSIYVRVDNGAELGEAHDVYDTTTNSSYGDLLVKSGSVWVNSRSLNGDYVVTGSLTVTQNLTVLGSSSLVYVTSSNLAVSASFISVNVFEPAERFGGLKVYDSGSANATASLAWDSLHNHWVYQNVSGSNYSGGMLLSGPRNTGSLGDEPNLINGRIVKSVGGDHIDVSIISETGTTITVAGDLVANSITGAFDYFGLVNRPTLISGSSQINITGTTGYSTFSSSVSSSVGLLSSSVATTTSGLSSSINSLSSSIDSLSSSVATTTLNLKNRVDSIEGITGSISSLNTYTGSNNTVIGTLQTATGSLNTFTSSASGRLDSLESASSSIRTTLNSYTSSNDSTNTTQNSRLTSIEGITGSISSLNSFTASINTTIKSKLDSENVVSGSSQIIYSGLTGIPSGIVSGSIQVELTGTTGYSTFSSSISTSIGALSSSISTTTLGTKNRVDSIESKTGSYATTGSNVFIGNQNINGNLSVTGSGNITGDLTVQGNLIAQQYIVSSSVTYLTTSFSSGSTKFGDSLDDTHQFTGSVLISGSIVSTTTPLVSGSSQISYSGLTGIPSGIVSGSSQVLNGSGVWSGSAQLPSGVVSGSSQIIYSGLTGIPSDIVSGSSQLTGSYDTRYVLSGSITQTTWDNIASKPPGIISGSVQIVNLGFATTSSNDLYGDRYLFSTALSTGSWVINHNLGFQFPNVDIYDSSNQILIPQAITATSANSMQIDFATPTIGKAILTIGGARSTGLFVQSGSFYNATTNIGITGSLVVTGDVDANNFNTTSDKKLKTNLVRIENALDKIEKLNGYTFDWLEEYSEDRTRQIGMVADEVYEVQPELISHRNIVLSNKEEKIKLLDYSKVTAILIEAIKELNDKVTKLENKKKKK